MHDLRLLAVSMVSLSTALGAQTAPVTIRAGRLLDGRGAVMENATIVVHRAAIERVDRGAAANGVATYDLSG